MPADIKLVYDTLNAHPDSNYRSVTFNSSISANKPCYVKYACSDASHTFEITLDEKLLRDEHDNDVKMEKLYPKYKCAIYMKENISDLTWVKMLDGIIMNVERMGNATTRKKWIRLSGTDWATCIMKKRVLKNLSFTGAAFSGESGTGVSSTAKVVCDTIIDSTNDIGEAGITFSADSIMDSTVSPTVAWPKIARDFSNRTAFDSFRAVAKEVGADFWSNKDSQIRLAGWMTQDSGKNYTDDDVRDLRFSETANSQTDNVYTGPGTLRIFPVERIDKWMEVENWNKSLMYYMVATKNEATRDGSSMMRMTANNLPTGLGEARVFGCMPNNATSSTAGGFELPFVRTNANNNNIISECRMVRFYLQFQTTSGGPVNSIDDHEFFVYIGSYRSGGYRAYKSRPLKFSRDNPPITKWYDLSLENAGSSGSDFPDEIGGGPNSSDNIQFIDFYLNQGSTSSWICDIGELHLVYESTQKKAVGVQNSLPLFEGINIDPSLISGGDSLTMAERISTMTKANDEGCKMELVNPDLDWGDSKYPGMYLELQSDFLEIPDETPSTYKKMRVETVEQFYKAHKIKTTIRCERVPFQGNAASEHKVQNVLDTLLAYDTTDAGEQP